MADIPHTVQSAGSILGAEVGNYRITRLLGEGGMGAVYEAVHRDPQLTLRVAVKVLHGDRLRDEELERFYNEARAISRAKHPGLVKVLDYGVLGADQRPFIVMELVEGESLRHRLQRLGRLSTAAALRATRQIATALAAVHESGIIHRDLKPDNVMLVADPDLPARERTRVLDFGIAKMFEANNRVTQEGMIIGTAEYMSPEQCSGDMRIGPPTDIYSMGVMLYEMLAGQVPFTGNWMAIVFKHMTGEPTPLRDLLPELPQSVADLVYTAEPGSQSMLAREPARRPTMAEIAICCEELELALARTSPEPMLDLGPTPLGPVLKSRLGSRLIAAMACGAIGMVLLAGLFLYTRAMVVVPGTTFWMGSTADEIRNAYDWCLRENGEERCGRELYDWETPRRQVTVSTFRMDRTEATNEQLVLWLNERLQEGVVRIDQANNWAVAQNGARLVNLYPKVQTGFGLAFRDGRFAVGSLGLERRPATQVTWKLARWYCASQGKRLPTEAEWELAARGPAGYTFPWGNLPPRCDKVVIARSHGQACSGQESLPAQVGIASQDLSVSGVRDLAGNVGEWVGDRFRKRYPDCPQPCRDPSAPEDSAPGEPVLRGIRGGSWALPVQRSRGAARSWGQEEEGIQDVGFRCVKPGA